MNEITKQIFLDEMDTALVHIESLRDSDSIVQEISGVTDPGNLRAAFINMRYYLETGAVPESLAGYSSLPAVVFGLPALQNFLEKEFNHRVSCQDISEMSDAYLREYRRLASSDSR